MLHRRQSGATLNAVFWVFFPADRLKKKENSGIIGLKIGQKYSTYSIHICKYMKLRNENSLSLVKEISDLSRT